MQLLLEKYYKMIDFKLSFVDVAALSGSASGEVRQTTVEESKRISFWKKN